MRRLEFFFDYECPFCKRGHEYLMEALKKHPGIEVIWKPCEAHPRPEDHPNHTDLCIQGYYQVAETGGDVLTYHERLYDAIHKDRINIEDLDTLAAYVADITDDGYKAAIKENKYADKLAEGNNYAYEKNEVWFLPAFRMDGKKLDAAGGVGVTREQVEEFLEGN